LWWDGLALSVRAKSRTERLSTSLEVTGSHLTRNFFKMNKRILFLLSLFLFLLGACKDKDGPDREIITYGETYFNDGIHTDKARYAPGQPVTFYLRESPKERLTVNYYHLGDLISSGEVTSSAWTWTPPDKDYRGYLVQLLSGEKLVHSIAVDVSADWKKFPRYGFLSSFGNMSESSVENTVNTLNRYHINGIQFYDWHYEHHQPLAGTGEAPQEVWRDIIGRDNSLATVRNYIKTARSKNMTTMFYNLAMGALDNAAQAGVKESWYLFKDQNHNQKDYHPLGPPFKSNIYLTNPANEEWQNYLGLKNNDVYTALDFDGFHVDQLGNRGDVYDYPGQKVQLDQTYKSFLEAMKRRHPDKRLVMNAVSQFGQENSISKADVDFLYTEVWNETRTYEDLAGVILDNDAYSGGTRKTVLAAYMNYAKSAGKGYLNKPGILLANSVIFAFGGAHLELGEHYLSNEYFPNSNLQMKADLKEELLAYYDFMVSYQNLLRDGGSFSAVTVSSGSNQPAISSWPAGQGQVAAVTKKLAGRQVVHLINFTRAGSMEWRDTNATQPEPETVTGLTLTVGVTQPVKKAWLASPDLLKGQPRALSFTNKNGSVEITIPSLKYWDMIVFEY